jgi:hypothetical protein
MFSRVFNYEELIAEQSKNVLKDHKECFDVYNSLFYKNNYSKKQYDILVKTFYNQWNPRRINSLKNYKEGYKIELREYAEKLLNGSSPRWNEEKNKQKSIITDTDIDILYKKMLMDMPSYFEEDQLIWC